MLKDFGPLNPKEVVLAVKQIIKAFSFLNDQGYSYGVIRTQDIFLVATEKIKI
jgi:hypothetical protein